MPSKDESKWARDVRRLVLTVVAMGMFLAVMLVDSLWLRPREPFSEIDSQLLEQELARIVENTSALGKWQEKEVFLKRHSGGFVSSKFAISREKQIALVEALKGYGWRPYSPIEETDITLCKGKYRVDLEWLDSGTLLTTFYVKQYKKEPNCI